MNTFALKTFVCFLFLNVALPVLGRFGSYELSSVQTLWTFITSLTLREACDNRNRTPVIQFIVLQVY